MDRRTLVAAAVITLLAASAHGAEPARSHEAALPAQERPLELRALFDIAPGVVLAEGADGIAVGPMSVEVIVARLDSDGKLVKACVNSEEAARRFLQAPVENIRGRKAQEK